ncbi:MAG: DsbA family protein [Acidimicrobiales bacterium]
MVDQPVSTTTSDTPPFDEPAAGRVIPAFKVTWDYRCPFARNAHEHLVAALEEGADFDVTFVGYSLSQAHLEEGATSVWEEPAKDTGILAMQVGIAVRDKLPDDFLAVHRALFALRHDEGGDLRDEAALRRVLVAHGVDPELVFAEIESSWPIETFRKEHEAGALGHDVWGVPTFIVEEQAVFVRVMTRPAGDGKAGRRTIERIVGLICDMPELNEFKHTSIPR